MPNAQGRRPLRQKQARPAGQTPHPGSMPASTAAKIRKCPRPESPPRPGDATPAASAAAAAVRAAASSAAASSAPPPRMSPARPSTSATRPGLDRRSCSLCGVVQRRARAGLRSRGCPGARTLTQCPLKRQRQGACHAPRARAQRHRTVKHAVWTGELLLAADSFPAETAIGYSEGLRGAAARLAGCCHPARAASASARCSSTPPAAPHAR
jgi:hypothetical protein